MARIAPLTIDWQPDRTSNVPVTEQIVDYMCRQVSSGAWPIGSRLPSQRAMSESFGVNRSTVIAAITELADYGIVEGMHGAGTRIVSNTWSLMLPGAPDWADYVSSGFFEANNATIQTINRMEFAPDISRLGTGELDPRLFPRDMWRRVLGEASREIDSLGYPPPAGMPALREAIAEHMCRTGVACTPSQVLITSGALQALQMISVSLLSNGSTVFAEAPSYIKSLQVFQSAGMRLSGVPMDGDGLRVDALERALRAQRGGSDAVLYTIPTNHNPTGITMRDARRHELIACCVANRLPIIEDNAYQDLYFDGPTPTPLKTLDKTGMVITLGSASKALSPGLRIGWLVASEPIVQRLADVKMQMDYGASVLSQWVYTRFLTSGLYDEYLVGLKRELRRRRDAALETLERRFAGQAHWITPEGGFYIWLTFDQPLRIGKLFQTTLERGVLLNPGDIYDFEGDNSLRLSYSYTTPEEFAAAVDVLAGAVRDVRAHG
ncbi:PLP-dependent aminotransferase family protein [Bifidobacterium scardovii]|uniref:Putative HTH-type transcriptional regulator NorG n=1 Tax=Bifidobacterium scardovii TaxID=158787 RepID=A0A087DJT2_9BIFI|nr:PLP-dependent aminotransferase family protein [Bifidobacterium scardovii]KFI95782.1 putative HTH-type transcriptional regulator NorG [Bifidobacterium scardovii]MDK6349371.1 PLP-dependent aminotransferase family protein [Bifidobacterium scardovii]MDU8982093.1 PLP-dependent aminotransferase family protein [Bifidobacterium scardovii]BAQ30527.1 putative transcriptional regulator [Bifidobacterium scardovii JCM 12489 = DSM 13734]